MSTPQGWGKDSLSLSSVGLPPHGCCGNTSGLLLVEPSRWALRQFLEEVWGSRGLSALSEQHLKRLVGVHDPLEAGGLFSLVMEPRPECPLVPK